MLGTPEVTEAVAEFLETLSCPIVIDPVMVAKSGDRLLHADAIVALREVLIPKATVITPNLPEAADLLGASEATGRDSMQLQAKALLALGPRAVLLKGGHLLEESSPDLLMSGAKTEWFETLRVVTTNTHGTGCTLSSALASYLGQGYPIESAVAKAKEYISGAIATADQLTVGEGHGPVNHFWALWGNNG
jgi:hydroxymethylpyrimidine/phosphomethylpyrimidine kinase